MLSVIHGMEKVLLKKMKNNKEFKDLAIHSFTINRDVIYFGVSKEADPEIYEKLKKAVKKLSTDGTFKAIEAKWKDYK